MAAALCARSSCAESGASETWLLYEQVVMKAVSEQARELSRRDA